MKEIELIEKRNRKEKHFLQEDGTIIAKLYNDDIHFFKNGRFEEIDNTLIKKNGCYVNKNNKYKISLDENTKNGLIKLELNEHYITINLKNSNNVNIQKSNKKSKYIERVKFENIIDDIDLDYDILPTKIKESIILKKAKNKIDEIIFDVDTDLVLELNSDKSINAKFEGVFCFIIEPPYMIDTNGKRNSNCYYELIRKNKKYELKLVLDQEWLNSEDIKYPVLIDPTISTQNTGVYDTYIYSGDSNTDRNSQDILKAGVERINGQDVVNRALIKFDLPTIGTGSQVIQAIVNLVGYPASFPDDSYDIMEIHRITTDWNETTANWNTMNDKFDERIEASFQARRSFLNPNNVIEAILNSADITDLVRRWYTDVPNYGFMLKANKEQYMREYVPAFISKNNSVPGENPKPVLIVSYRNQNGLEDYMEYMNQYFDNGSSHINLYNGNLISVFDIGRTIGGSLPVKLDLIYNTNDVILENDYGCGLGLKFSVYQTIKAIIVDEVKYLEYLDADGTIHYFNSVKNYIDENGEVKSETENNKYFDEDNLNITILENSNDYILTDENNNTMKFAKINNVGYLTEFNDLNGKKITITYNSNNLITKIKDGNNLEINIIYETNKISILSPSETIILNYNNNKLTSIVSLIGTKTFSYNSNNLISEIILENGKKNGYQYYNQTPYKIKRLIEYGLNNTEGVYYDLIYNFSSTTVIDNKNRASTITFNNYGNAISISNLKSKEDINNSYGQTKTYGEYFQYKNKILRNYLPIRCVKNLLNDSSFENGEEHGFVGEVIPTSNISITDTESATRNKCLRVLVDSLGKIVKTIRVPKGKYYTFSASFKNDSEFGIYLSCENGTDAVSDIVLTNLEFTRYSASIYFPKNDDEDYGNLDINISFNNPAGYVYMDDIQLEEGEVANNYNYIENSDFSKGLSGWELQAIDMTPPLTEDAILLPTTDKFQVVSLSNSVNVLKIKMDPSYSTYLSKRVIFNGKAGDLYTICFWYKNESTIDNINYSYNNVILRFEYDDNGNGQEAFPSTKLNPNNDEWQFFSCDFVAIEDFKAIKLDFFQQSQANNLYITNINVFKDIRNSGYNYDENGNIQSSYTLNNVITEFNYDKNNELIKMTKPKGNNFIFEYDNIITNRVINGISATGISNQIRYDTYGNPINTKIINYNQSNEIQEGLYKIRLKGTDNYLRITDTKLSFDEDDCNHDLWNFVKDGEYFKINHSIITSMYLINQNDTLILSNYQDNKSLFKLIKNNNGSYSLQNKNNDKYVKFDNNSIIFDEYEEIYNYEFYLEKIDNTLFVEANAEYTEDGRFIKNTTDSNFNKSSYDIDTTTGLIKSITNAKNQITNYIYNDKKQLIKVINNDKVIDYVYNINNLLSKIKSNGKEYNFDYDEFLNIKQVKLGDNITFITNEYEINNGNLKSVTYGNNHVITYDYDEFDRISKITKTNAVYNYKYDSNNNLAKIITNNYEEKFDYDLAKRLHKYRYNNFDINYSYDSNNNIVSVVYNLDENEYFAELIYHTINNVFNNDDNLIESTFENNKINYTYDYLGRLVNKKINNNYNIDYEYITNGNRTTFLVKSIKNSNDRYSYKYDKLNNITHIYSNHRLINKYKYDEYNQLLEENNYLTKKTIRYKYDNSGNILSRNIYELNSYNLLDKNIYEYSNSNWEDQLTKFNDDIITYDEIGNPITIGNKTLLWINGRELNNYNDQINNISYKYNEKGIRISKTINYSETEYFLENNRIIFEKNNDKLIYFMYNEFEELIGFEYNNSVYYYLKNAQNDVIGILDSNYDLIATYTYDAFGNVLSICDSNNNDITANNNHIANVNPFRYRSYYYDRETNLYYLNSRYYNPVWGRFLNADNYISTKLDLLGLNTYSYCYNNFINYSDYNGHAILFGMLVGICALSGVIIGNQLYQQAKAKKEIEEVQKKKNIPDKTDELNKKMQKSAIELKGNTKNMNPVEKLRTFAKAVNNGSEYDLKLQPEWNQTIMYDGIIMDPQDVGNFHYGYIGAAIGIHEDILVLGAGANQLKNHKFKTIQNCLTPSYCDDPRDTYYIRLGIIKYNSEN